MKNELLPNPNKNTLTLFPIRDRSPSQDLIRDRSSSHQQSETVCCTGSGETDQPCHTVKPERAHPIPRKAIQMSQDCPRPEEDDVEKSKLAGYACAVTGH